MSDELFWLAATTLFTALMWLPYILNRMAVRGVVTALTDTGPENGPHSLWAERAIRAHRNAIENLVVFAVLVLIADRLDLHAPMLALAAAVYFWTRVVHFVVYALGIPFVRTVAFAVGWMAQMIFAAAIFGWM